jgi:hypothetical protein
MLGFLFCAALCAVLWVGVPVAGILVLMSIFNPTTKGGGYLALCLGSLFAVLLFAPPIGLLVLFHGYGSFLKEWPLFKLISFLLGVVLFYTLLFLAYYGFLKFIREK